MPRVPPSIAAIVFDAVGTLIYPEPCVADVYRACGRRFGYSVQAPEFSRRFRRATRHACWQPATDEQHREVWRSIVQCVFDDSSEHVEPIFDALWHHFAQPAAWRLYDDVLPTLTTLAERGWQLVVASNFDRRLRDVCRGIEELQLCANVFCATDFGVAKPDAKFFDHVSARLQLPPSCLLMVGDDYEVDIVPARRRGWHAVHLQRDAVGTESSIHHLGEILG